MNTRLLLKTVGSHFTQLRLSPGWRRNCAPPSEIAAFGFGLQALGSRAPGLEIRVGVRGFTGDGLGFGVWGSGFRI